MSISGALSNAMSGLRAAGRGAEIVSSNISNALTPGYARRALSLSSSGIGTYGGVRINGIDRLVDAGLVADRRLADAETANAQARTDFLARIDRLLGTPDDPSSLSARLSAFETSLITAASRPDAPERLTAAVAAARDLAGSLSSASEGIQDARTQADRSISSQVTELNTALEQVQSLNARITATLARGGEVAALQDQRQQVVDRIGVLVPVREVPRDNGQVALYTIGGAVLIDGKAATIGFERVNLVTPYMSVEDGTLSGLTINGKPVRTDNETGALRGGTLGAHFDVRDSLAPDAQREIDALARDLVERFQGSGVDPTLGTADAGLFTDAGAAFIPADEVGLASRLVVNANVDPREGGAAWRLRDGINATAPGDVGNASLLQNLAAALTATRTPSSGSFGGGAFSAASLASNLVSEIAVQRTDAEQKLSFAAARLNELTERQLADGVDSDDEIQRLILIEQVYAANARMIEAADEMMQTILRL